MDQLSLNNTSASFMGAVVDEVNGPSDDHVRVALNHGYRLLTIQEFIEVTKFVMDPVMVNYFWQIMVNSKPGHVTRLILEWFGYEGDYAEQKRRFVTILKRNNIPYKELKHTDEDVSLYPTIENEIEAQPSKALAHQKWLVMDPDDLKQAIMKLNTKNGNTIRAYYISLEKLVRLYAEYCLYYNHREAQREISDLKKLMEKLTVQNEEMKLQNQTLINQNNELLGQNDDMAERMDGVQASLDVVQDKLDIAVEDRAPRVHTNTCREHFILFNKGSDEPYPYYVIRGQKGYCDRTIAKHKITYPNLTITVDMVCQPNPRNLYIRFRERHVSLKSKDKIMFKIDGNNVSLNNNSES